VRLARRLAATILLSGALFGATALIGAPAALAHPLGNFTINHFSGLTVTPGHVRITYALDMAEIPTFQQSSSIDADGDGRITGAERAAWAGAQGAAIAPLLELRVNGLPVALANDCGSAMVFRPGQGGLPILRLVSVFDAAVPASGRLTFVDRTFPDRIGWKEITATGGPGASVTGSTVPSRSVSGELLRYPTNLLQSPLSVTRASLSYSSGGAGHALVACPGTATGTPKAATSAFASLITWKLTPIVLIGSLLLAFAFGVLHAVGPGHGKTITAAYLVGSGARAKQAVGVGIAVASMHTLSVLGLGVLAVVLSSSFPAERIYPWLTVVTGAVAVVLGATMLIMRVRALRRGQGWHGHSHPWDVHADDDARERHTEVPEHLHAHEHTADRVLVGAVHGWGTRATAFPEPDLDGGSEHTHGSAVPGHAAHGEGSGGDHRHDHGAVRVPSAGPSKSAVSRPRLAALAVSGGLLPSPTALVVLLAAISAHRLAYGLSLIVAFSAGLAAALITIAVLALRARGFVDRRLGTRLGRVIPVLSAVVIVGFGVFFLTKGVLQVGA
jgi:ABC-type nickel/cobalt efflux system permease component RcnA